MPTVDPDAGYLIWGVDHIVYGPVELPILVNWIKDERVTSDTWLFLERDDCWEKATQVPELQLFFRGRSGGATSAGGSSGTAVLNRSAIELSPTALRHIKLFASFTDDQLEQFLELTHLENVPAGARVFRQGEPANTMFLIVEGELHVRAILDGHDLSLGFLKGGEFIGEISLFDQGPRYAEVTANQDCTLLRISAAEFERFALEKPSLAAPFLYALCKTISCRVRGDQRRYRDSVAFIHPPAR